MEERSPKPCDNVVIRRTEPSDFEAVTKLMTFPNVIRGTLQLPYPSLEEWKKRLLSNPTDMYCLCATVDGELVSCASITINSRLRVRHVGEVGISVRDDFHRRGIGLKMMTALIDLADNWLNLARVELSVFTDNAPALALYEKLGFKIEGTRVASCFREGKYIDTHIMARLRPGFNPNSS